MAGLLLRYHVCVSLSTLFCLQMIFLLIFPARSQENGMYYFHDRLQSKKYWALKLAWLIRDTFIIPQWIITLHNCRNRYISRFNKRLREYSKYVCILFIFQWFTSRGISQRYGEYFMPTWNECKCMFVKLFFFWHFGQVVHSLFSARNRSLSFAFSKY